MNIASTTTSAASIIHTRVSFGSRRLHRRVTGIILPIILALTLLLSKNVRASITQQAVIEKVEITGVASSLAEAFLRASVLAYELISPNVTLTFQYGTSSVLQPQLFQGQADFGLFSSSTFLTTAQKQAYPDLIQIPLIGVAAVPTYRIPSLPVGSDPLKFSAMHLARILRANITKWNDPDLVAVNPCLSGINANITLVSGIKYANSLTDVYMKWLCRIDPLLATTIGCTLSTYDPSKVKGLHWYGSTTTLGITTIMNTVPNSFTFVAAYQAMTAGLMTGYLINSIGTVIQPTKLSTQLPMYERALVLDSLGNSDLTQAAGANSWPMVQFQNLQLPATFIRVNCETRVEFAKFLKWLYTSDVSNQIAIESSVILIPNLIYTELGIDKVLEEQIQCDGVAVLPKNILSTGVLYGNSALSSILPYLLDFYYGNIQTTTQFVWYDGKSYADTRTTLKLAQSDATIQVNRQPETEIGFLYLPLFLVATQPVFKLPAAVMAYPGLLPLVIDIDTLAAIFSGQILSWLDVRIIQYNPILANAINATGMDPTLGVVICCSNKDVILPVSNLFMGSLKYSSVLTDSPLITLPVDFSTVFPLNTTSSSTSGLFSGSTKLLPNYVWAQSESELIPLTSGLSGYIGYRQVISNTSDDTVAFRVLPWSGSSRAGAMDGLATADEILMRKQALSGIPVNQVACVSNDAMITAEKPNNFLDLDAAFLDWTSPLIPPECYAFTSLIDVGLPSSYSGLNCDRGGQTLELMAWLATTTAVSAAGQSVGLGMLTDIEAIRTAVIDKLKSVQCDGETILEVQAHVWVMNQQLSNIGIAISSVFIGICCITLGLLYLLRDRSVFRSASVLFLGFTLVGLILLLISALLWSIRDVTDATCQGFTFASHLGFTLTFIPLFIKTYRIYYIFGAQRQLKVIKMSNSKLSIFVGLALAFDLLILILWTQSTTSPLQAQTTEQNDAKSLHHHYTQCSPISAHTPEIHTNTFHISVLNDLPDEPISTDGYIYFGILISTKIISLGIGALLSFATRNVTELFNESRSIAFSIWNSMFTILILSAILLLLGVIGDLLIGIVLFLLIWIASSIFYFLFIQKFMKLEEWIRWKSAVFGVGSRHGMGGHGNSSMLGGSSTDSHATHNTNNHQQHGGGHLPESTTLLSPLGNNLNDYHFLSLSKLTSTDSLIRYILEGERHMNQAKMLYLKLGGFLSFFTGLRYLDNVVVGGGGYHPTNHPESSFTHQMHHQQTEESNLIGDGGDEGHAANTLNSPPHHNNNNNQQHQQPQQQQQQQQQHHDETNNAHGGLFRRTNTYSRKMNSTPLTK